MRLRAEEIVNLVVGTAGHIDHGKSSLVRALTGIDPDRLKEEIERGMTIDLGFARLRLADGRTLGLIDVPGHERFVKNMVAGATGIDLVMLVVAADDGVMPQTREHLEILGLLGISRGLVAITKVDLESVDADIIGALESELDELLAGTFLAGAPRLRVSSVTGQGLPELKTALEAAVAACPPRATGGPFRMPVQRVFSARGFGTVLTGVPLSGELGQGDAVEVHLASGQAIAARVRGLHAYASAVERVRAGHSSALNVPDVPRDAATRGDVVAAPGLFQAAPWWEVRLEHLASQRRPLKDRETVRVHLGTAELIGELVLLDRARLEPGQGGWAQLRLSQPTVAAPGDRFVLRRHSPVETLGGGVVLGASRHRLKAMKPRVLERLRRREAALGDPLLALEVALDEVAEGSEEAAAGLDVLGPMLGSPRAEVEALIARGLAAGRVVELGGGAAGPSWLTRETHRAREGEVGVAAASALEALAAWVKAHPARAACPQSELRKRAGLADELLQRALERLAKAQQVRAFHPPESGRRAVEAGWAPADHAPRLSPAEERFAAAVVGRYGTLLAKTPTLDEALVELRVHWLAPAAQRDVILALFEKGELALLEDDVVVSARALAAATEATRRALAGGPQPTSVLREAMGASRKVAVAVLEHLDLVGVTHRTGDLRGLKGG